MQNSYKHSYKHDSKDILSLVIHNVGYQKCAPLYKWGVGIRDHYLIHHIISGKGYFKTPDGIYSLKKGDTFLIYPGTEVSYWADSRDPWEYYWVGFSGNDAEILLSATDLSRSTPYISTEFGDSLKSALLNIYNCKGNTFFDSARMTGYLYIALSLIIEKSKQKQFGSQSKAYVEKASEYIANNYSNPISIDDIAKFVGISRSQLSRAFLQEIHTSPWEYLVNLRVKKACYLLCHSDLTVKSIAVSVGYSDNLYFSKAFKKHKGCTPSEYRNDNKVV